MTETVRQYASRHLRLAIETAKIAVMEAHQEAQAWNGDAESVIDLLAAAHSRLDKAWGIAFKDERAQQNG